MSYKNYRLWSKIPKSEVINPEAGVLLPRGEVWKHTGEKGSDCSWRNAVLPIKYKHHYCRT
jgi:hypothetical protein